MTAVVLEPQTKGSRSRVALVLLCGLALACTIMTITSDESEVIQEEAYHKVVSVDVDKVGVIYTAVPPSYKGLTGGGSGRVRLLNYFKEIERRIAAETAARKQDIVQIRTKMQKNRELNAEARKNMKKFLLNQMAINAKKAKDELKEQMAITARKFADAAALANKRNRETRKRARRTREIMRKNKKEAAKNLREATENQQRALATLDQQMNEKIRKTNTHIAANAAQIKMNAKKARDELDKANEDFQNKMFNVNKEAKEARDALSVKAHDMDKKLRAFISTEVQGVATKTAAEFSKVRTKMAADRQHADLMLKHETTNLAASLHQQQVLQDKRFQQTVDDIKKAKEEADALVEKMQSQFKVNIMHLQSEVENQVTELKNNEKKLAGTVTKNRLDQAEVNRHVQAELKRMVKLGSDHEATLAKKDKALRNLMIKNKEANEKEMLRMANDFNNKLSDIKKQMKKDRSHAENNLKKQTGALYDALLANKKAQAVVNKELEAQRARVKLDAEDNLRKAKDDFTKRLAELHATVKRNDEKADKKIKKLTGIVDANAVKDADGRKALKLLAAANKAELKTAVENAVNQGEQRALQVEKTAKDMNDKMRNQLNLKITTQIGALTKKIHASVEDLQLSTKEARAEMKREVLYAVREAAQAAKDNLAEAVKWSNSRFQDLDKQLEDGNAESKLARDALKQSIEDEKTSAHRVIKDAVAAQNRALLALKTVTAKKIKKTNLRVDAYGAAIKKNAEDVSKQMKANADALKNKLESAKQKAKTALKGAKEASIKRKKDAIDFIKNAIQEADEEAQLKFGKLYKDMAKDRMDMDNKLAAEALAIQEVIAKRSALYDTRFEKTVKSLDLARKEATKEVSDARKAFTTAIVGITAAIKDQETTLTGEVELVGTQLTSYKAQQTKVNNKVDAELERILKLVDTRKKENKRARGKLKAAFDEHKALAAQERENLKNDTQKKLRKLRRYQAKVRQEFAEDLSKTTKALYLSLTQHAEEQKNKQTEMQNALSVAKVSSAAAMKRAKEQFQARLTTVTNLVTANHLKFEIGLDKITGVVHDWKRAAGLERQLLKDQVISMEKDLHKAITRAIQIGEAKAKAVQERALINANVVKRALSGEIADRVEKMADDVFRAVLENRGKIADNYLALKAYCGSAADKIIDYTTKGQGRALFSLGDLLTLVASLSTSKTKPQEGVGAGGEKVFALFNGDSVKVETSFTKANGLVNEWSKAISMIRTRWQYGLGKYLLTKISFAMQNEGLLSVGNIPNKNGQYVFINAHAIGLSNRLSALDKLASRAKDYQAFLAHLNAKLPKKKSTPAKKQYYVNQDGMNTEWKGD